MQPKVFTVADVCQATRQCDSLVRDAIRSGDLKTFVVGRRHLIRPESVSAWLDHLEAASERGHPIAYRARAPRNDESQS